MMRAAVVQSFGKPSEVVAVVNNMPKPVLEKGDERVLVKVLACSTSPGDVRTMTGSVKLVRNPGFPYIPSGDVCGIVEEVNAPCDVAVGQTVVGTWQNTPYNGMAEYMLVDRKLVVPKPDNVSVLEAAALPNSSANAMLVLRDNDVLARIKPGERVLVIGGGGGVGTTLLQLLRDSGAKYVASVSNDGALMKSLGVDKNVVHSSETWWADEEFQKDKFDIVIDCAEGVSGWRNCRHVLKTGWQGGRYMQIPMDNPWQDIVHWTQMLRFICTVLFRPIWTRLLGMFMPRWQPFFGAPRGDSLQEVFELVKADKFKVVQESAGPFEFSTRGVRSAFDLQATYHAHGKIVVKLDPSLPDK